MACSSHVCLPHPVVSHTPSALCGPQPLPRSPGVQHQAVHIPRVNGACKTVRPPASAAIGRPPVAMLFIPSLTQTGPPPQSGCSQPALAVPWQLLELGRAGCAAMLDLAVCASFDIPLFAQLGSAMSSCESGFTCRVISTDNPSSPDTLGPWQTLLSADSAKISSILIRSQQWALERLMVRRSEHTVRQGRCGRLCANDVGLYPPRG
jgi:hypothetical protein